MKNLFKMKHFPLLIGVLCALACVLTGHIMFAGLPLVGGMILDERNEFADAVAITGTAATTYVLGDVIDLGATARDIGNGTQMYLGIFIDTTVLAAGGAANVTFKLVSDSVATLDNSPTVHFATAAIAKGTLVAGYQVCFVALPLGTYERYLGVTFTPDTNDTTAGKANAFLTADPHGWRAYADGVA